MRQSVNYLAMLLMVLRVSSLVQAKILPVQRKKIKAILKKQSRAGE